MTNWKEIHPDFIEILQKKWEDKGFSKIECQEWLRVGLKVDEMDFADHLREKLYNPKHSKYLYKLRVAELRVEYYEEEEKFYIKQLEKEYDRFFTLEVIREARNLLTEYTEEDWNRLFSKVNSDLSNMLEVAILLTKIFQPQKKEILDNELLKSLLDEKSKNTVVYRAINDHNNLVDNLIIRVHQNHWKITHSVFTPELQKEWEERSLDYEECKEWINVGLTPHDADYVWWLKNVKKFSPVQFFDCDSKGKLRAEYAQFEQEVKTGVKLSADVIEKVRFFPCYSSGWAFFLSGSVKLTNEQYFQVEQLIKNKELRDRFVRHGLCEKCWQPRTGYEWCLVCDSCLECNQPETGEELLGLDHWCQPCVSRHIKQDFNKLSSGNLEIDKLIQEYQLKATSPLDLLEWIPYEKFRNVQHLASGGFGETYKAIWDEGPIEKWDAKDGQWLRKKDKVYSERGYNISLDYKSVALKELYDSKNVSAEFLREITYCKLVGGVSCYGISQNPTTKNYVMVMDYMEGGNLKQYLQNNYGNKSQIYLKGKLWQLFLLVYGGLSRIHNEELIHCDLHSGNILSNNDGTLYIADLGLCRPANETDKKKVYGVLPYVAPEVLCKRSGYTKASDVYSFGIIMYEILSGLPPFYEIPHDTRLAMRICQGLRPDLDVIQLPQLLKDLIKRCWDAEPKQRPTAEELREKLMECWDECSGKKNKETEFLKQCRPIFDKEMKASLERGFKGIVKLYQQFTGEEIEIDNPLKLLEAMMTLKLEFFKKYNYNNIDELEIAFEKLFFLVSHDSTPVISIHPQAIYHSRLLNFKNLSKPQNNHSQEWQTSTLLELQNTSEQINFEIRSTDFTESGTQLQTQIQVPPK